MTFLEKIIAKNQDQLAKSKLEQPLQVLAQKPYYQRSHQDLKSLRQAFLQSAQNHKEFPVLAEYKRRSPSKGLISERVLEEVLPAYEQWGAVGISILTESHFFGGCLEDLQQARTLVNKPLLRKDFIVDEYQIHQAKAYGADVILLICAALSVQQLLDLSAVAKALGLEVLLEVHDEQEIESCFSQGVFSKVDLVGINNRNLKTLTVDRGTSYRLIASLQQYARQLPKLSESGLDSFDDLNGLRQAGFDGFLIGEALMKGKILV